jgi:serine/threonine-protein kinase
VLDLAPLATPSAVEAWVPRPSEIIDGRYRIEEIVGIGTMGAVVAARHLALDRRIAIKFLRPERARDQTALDRFNQEAIAASRIRSDHVVRILDVGTTPSGVPFMAMELLEGSDLEKLVEKGPLPIALAVDCILQAAEVLAEAHVAGIIHRDIKPSNLFLAKGSDELPVLKVLDFGISKLAAEWGGDPTLTETQSMIGSPAYMAPEQVRTSKYVTAKVDVWALGVVLFELLTTKLPFDGDTLGAVLAALTVEPPRALRPLRADVPEAVEYAVFACLEKDPMRRATLGELAALLRPFASSAAALVSADRVARISAGASPSGPPPPSLASGSVPHVPSMSYSAPPALAAPARSRLPLILLAVGLVVVLATSIAFGLARRRSAQPPLDAATSVPSASAPVPTVAPSATPPLPTAVAARSIASSSPRHTKPRHPKPTHR